MKPKFHDLIIRNSNGRYRNYKNINVIGLDTETIGGYCRLLCDSEGRHLYIEDLKKQGIKDILNFLTNKKYRNSINFFYNVRYDFQSLIKYLNPKQLFDLYHNGVVGIDYNGYEMEVSYIPKKSFQIRYRKRNYMFFDISQFFNYGTLDEVSYKYLHLKKTGKDLDIELVGSSESYWGKHYNEILEYCINDAKLTKLLGEWYLKIMQKLPLNIRSRYWFSSAYLAEYWLRNNCFIPTLKNIPEEVIYYAYQSYHGGRFEVLSRGSLGYCYHYDINSAYPYHISQLLDISNGKWVKKDYVPDGVDYGFIKGIYIGNEDNIIEPVMVYDKHALGVFPHFTGETIITLDEYNLIKKFDLGEFKIIDGWFFYSNTPLNPFYKIKKLYEYRNILKKEKNDLELGIKVIINSVYGKFFEKRKSGMTGEWFTGKLFNPIYASIITSRTRCQIFELAYDNVNKVVSFATDSIITTKKIKVKESDELGGWKMDREGECVVIGSGVYKIGDKERTRALSGISAKKVLEYGAIKGVKSTRVKIKTKHVVTLGEVINHNQLYEYSDLNLFKKVIRKLDCNFDKKRNWYDEFKCFKEVFETRIDSEPWSYVI